MPEDPFAQQYGGMLPNIPMPLTNAAMIDSLLSDEHISDPELLKEFFWVFARDNSLTFLDEKRKMVKLMSFDIIKIDWLNSTPYYDYTFDEERKWSVMRNAFETKLDRSLGFSNNTQKNERTTQQSQFTESRTHHEDATANTGQRDNFLKRLLGRR
jgi:hypothetical protein